ncbi:MULTISPECIES: PRTRC system protein C [Pedobacter]|jgi:PRTRC genetic system protein C|uniref:PRTRC system protein C n=1 Tax=Pedobacter suwonensis TaxID=332999 RepID=A0A1I0TTP5_9SPHI|nr:MULTISPECIES: PRTRC system protein C [Pedobacter]SFA55090.1 PRTRC system protein C [Pedobacter suwonensis]
MMTATILPRVFVLKAREQDIRLSDPSGAFSPEQVMDFYSGTYPILTTAKIEGPEITGDEMQYRFITTLGTKG